MLSLLRIVRSRVVGFFDARAQERDFDDELRAHLEMAIEDKVRQGLSPQEARRRAHVELGNLGLLREAGREARGLPWLGCFGLDAKIGLRMLRRSWGLTAVAGFALTVVLGIGAFAFDLVGAWTGSRLPLDEGERIVALQVWDKASREGIGASPEDFRRWRDNLRSVEDVGAFRTVERYLHVSESASPDIPGEAIAVAEVSASAFELARITPARGRTLLPEDENPTSDRVLVIEHEVWESRFGSDPGILGRTVRLDGRVHTIVGVMPEGFGFPIFHRYWIPLQFSPEAYSPDAGRDDLFVFARLRDGVFRERVETELRRIGRLPQPGVEQAEVDLRVVPYVTALTGDADTWIAHLILLVVMLLLVPLCLNVAILVYARTISRQAEFAARFVLGASRFRIVFQLFLENLALALGAGALALVGARLVIRSLVANQRARGEPIPFWMDFSLAPRTVVYVGILAIFAALIAGVLPALRATGKSMQSGFKSLGGQHQKAHLGAVWTALIVLQFGVSSALLPTCAELVWGTVRSGVLGPGFAADRYLTAQLEPGPERAFDGETFPRRQVELVRALEARPGVLGVTQASHVPGEEPWLRIHTSSENDGPSGLEVGSHRVARVNRVDEAFLEVLDLQVLAGRPFEPGDFSPNSRAVIVNRSFVDHVLGGGDPLGRRIQIAEPREASNPEAGDSWFEIVGVVNDLHRNTGNQAVFRPSRWNDQATVRLMMRLGSDPTNAAGELRATAWDVDPALRVAEIRPLDVIYRQQAVGNYLGAGALVGALTSLLLLSGAGIYALMSFTVGQRRREIGIRAALGAPPGKIVASVFGPALTRVGLGASVGLSLALLVRAQVPIESFGGWTIPGVVPTAISFLVTVALLALLEPALRGLRIDPSRELREG